MEPEKKSNGAFVGLIVIVIILVIGGIYIWQSNKAKMEQAQPQSETVSDQDSNDLNTLEQDLNTTDTSAGVDAEAVN